MLKICQFVSKYVLTSRSISMAANPIDFARSVQSVLASTVHRRAIVGMVLLARLAWEVHNADSLECQQLSSEV